jgi:hypothetical protein
MANKYCINPNDDNDIRECNREEDPCCMCPGKTILVEVEDINEIIDLLKVSGSNTKQIVQNKLQSLLQ